MKRKREQIIIGQTHNVEMILPREVFKNIFCWLDIKSLGRCEHACKTFYHLIRDDHLVWMYVYSNTWFCVPEQMNRKLSWRDQTIARCELEHDIVGLDIFKKDLIEFTQVDSMDDIINCLADFQRTIPQIRDTLRVKKEWQENGVPHWLVQGTYFRDSSIHSTTPGSSNDTCYISWQLYGKCGNCLHFQLNYDYTDNSYRPSDYEVILRFYDEAGEIEQDILNLRDDHSNRGIIRPACDPVETFTILKKFLGDDQLTPSMLFDYLTGCTHFREKVYMGRVEDYFTFDINDKDKWPDLYQDSDHQVDSDDEE